MKYKINYGNKVAVIPEGVLDGVARAGEIDLKVLIALCSTCGSVDVKKLAKQFPAARTTLKRRWPSGAAPVLSSRETVRRRR